MELSRKSLHYKFYESAYPESNLPKNLCNYFWLLVLAVVLLPFSYPSHLVNLLRKKSLCHQCIGIIMSFSAILFSIPVYFDVKLNLWQSYFIGWCALITILAIIVLFVYCIVYIQDFFEKNDLKKYRKIYKSKKEKKPSMLSQYIRDYKNKNCSLINWRD